MEINGGTWNGIGRCYRSVSEALTDDRSDWPCLNNSLVSVQLSFFLWSNLLSGRRPCHSGNKRRVGGQIQCREPFFCWLAAGNKSCVKAVPCRRPFRLANCVIRVLAGNEQTSVLGERHRHLLYTTSAFPISERWKRPTKLRFDFLDESSGWWNMTIHSVLTESQSNGWRLRSLRNFDQHLVHSSICFSSRVANRVPAFDKVTEWEVIFVAVSLHFVPFVLCTSFFYIQFVFCCDAIASETVDQSSGMCWNQSKCASFWADRDKAHFIWRQVIMKMCRPACNSRLWFQSGRCANLRSCSIIWPSHFWTFLFKLKRREKEKDNSLNQ